MQTSLINQDTSSLDLTKVAALQQKRTLAFVNHFVITTVQFINNFSKQCEQKLMKFERKLEKINATLVLLDARLSSIPEINKPEIKEPQAVAQPSGHEVSINSVDNNRETKEKHPDLDIEVKPSTDNTSKEAKPEYERFIKMVQVGVPLDAVKLKVALEGLDPKELDIILSK